MVIALDGVEKRFGRITALAGLDLTVEAGEVVALAGGNGAGKTTTLHLLMGFLRADRGRLRLLGDDPLERRHLGAVGWMPERPAFPPRRRVRSLVAFQAATFPTWDDGLARRWIARLELPQDARAGDLSRGGAARLALLFALAHRPRVLLLDDPTLGLDPAGRRLVLGEVLVAAADSGAGVLVATHLLAEAERALDRLVLLRGGRVLLDAPVSGLRARYRRLELPAGAEPPPAVAPRWAGGGWLATEWDEAAWREYLRRVPAARARTMDLEDLYVALAGSAGDGGEAADDGRREVAA